MQNLHKKKSKLEIGCKLICSYLWDLIAISEINVFQSLAPFLSVKLNVYFYL